MKNSINKVLSGNYRTWAVLLLVILFVGFSGVILYFSYSNEDNTSSDHDDELVNGVFDGYNLFVLQEKNQENNSSKLRLMITDMDGKVIVKKNYLKEPRGLDNYPVELFNATTVLLGADDGAVLWNFMTNTTEDLGFKGHHDLEYNANNNTFFTMKWYTATIGEKIYGFDWINEYDWQGNLLWSLNTRSFISPSMWCPFNDSYVGETRDLTHGNTVFYDSEEDVLYYCTRNCNTFYKIDHKTKEIIWGLGEYGNFTLFDRGGNLREHLFFHAHSVEKIDANTFILFDNDMHNQTNPGNQRSRIVEITVNETTMIAIESWSWTAPVEYYSNIWGDADLLPNGNRLGTFGTDTHPNTDLGARLVEVNDSGDVVWEMNFPKENDFRYGVYRMERFRFTPTLSSPPDVWVLPTDSVTISWQTWYNFRAKQPMQGSYSVYLNDTLIENGNHVFNKWWLPSNLTISLGNFSLGTYNLTIVLADEVNNTISDNITIHVTTSSNIVQEGTIDYESYSRQPKIQWGGVAIFILIENKHKNDEHLFPFINEEEK